jgi:hypothetical protein
VITQTGRLSPYRKLVLILKRTTAERFIFRKMMRPGTIRLISIPEFEELPSVRLPPMRAARLITIAMKVS